MARPKKPKGLGDVIENITHATGIDKVVHAIAGDDCGCKERKEYLNKLFPFGKRVVNCLTDEQKEYLFATNIDGQKNKKQHITVACIAVRHYSANYCGSEKEYVFEPKKEYYPTVRALIQLRNL
jgi:hypothetical protein